MPGISPELIDSIQTRTALASENELYSTIGSDLPGALQAEAVTAQGLIPTDFYGIGRKFYEDHLQGRLNDAICGQLDFCGNRHIYDNAKDIVAMVAEEVGKVLATTHGLPAQGGGLGAKMLIEVSAAVLKEGLNKFCGCE